MSACGQRASFNPFGVERVKLHSDVALARDRPTNLPSATKRRGCYRPCRANADVAIFTLLLACRDFSSGMPSELIIQIFNKAQYGPVRKREHEKQCKLAVVAKHLCQTFLVIPESEVTQFLPALGLIDSSLKVFTCFTMPTQVICRQVRSKPSEINLTNFFPDLL